MLILARKEDEEILLGNEIVIKVVEISGNSVKLGIDAPKSMVILRRELQERIKASNIEASRHADATQLERLKGMLDR